MDVAWLDVAMDHAALVRIVEPATHLGHDFDFVLEPLGSAFLHHLREADAVEQLHDDIGDTYVLELAKIEDRYDVGMLELRHRLRFPVEPAAHLLFDDEVLGHHLDGDEAVENRIAGFVDGAHGPAAKLSEDDVFVDFFGSRGHKP